MNLNPRERVLIFFLPAAVVLAGYMFVFGQTVQKNWSSTRARLAGARAKAVERWQLLQARQELKEINEQLTGLAEDRQRLLGEAGDLCDRQTEPRELLSAANQVEKLLNENQLFVFEESESAAGGMALAASLQDAQQQLGTVWADVQQEMIEQQEAAARVAKRQKGVTVAASYAVPDDAAVRSAGEVRLRRVRFFGTFDDAARALTAMSQRQGRAVPVGISMTAPGLDALHTGSRDWILTIKM